MADYPGTDHLATGTRSDAADGDRAATEAAGGEARMPSGTVQDAPVPPDLFDEARFFRRLGLSKPTIARHAAAAMRNATTIETELIVSGNLEPDTYYEALAEILDLPFLADLPAERVADSEGCDVNLIRPTMIRLNFTSRPPIFAAIPTARGLSAMRQKLVETPALRDSLVVTTPAALRRALWTAGRQKRLERTTNALFEKAPAYSARLTLWGRQGFHVGLALCLLLTFLVLRPMETLLALHVVPTLLFFAALVLRVAAVFAVPAARQLYRPGQDDTPRPVYTVLVPLYREAAMVPQLLAALDRLAWPRSRLDIKLVCEADDTETIDALRARRPGPEYEIVEVPPGAPRTKPKALCYALCAARGAYLVIFDAEDRPDPWQLEEAWSRFRKAPPTLACLQAPLIVSNGAQSWLSALFALEYAALFRGLLPLLAALRLPMPLGGTSNHFRMDALRRAGGWDPYNVTEDADIGLRLHRLGYRCGVLTRPTLESAPTEVGTWLAQRTRWFKGWLQTWLVLMRHPLRLMRDLGPVSFLLFHVLIGGMLVSSLCHPLLLGFVAATGWRMMTLGTFSVGPLALALFVIDTINIFGSYAVFVALGIAAMRPRERPAAVLRLLHLPVYWMLVALAAWRAVEELQSRPFAWNKTPHQPEGVLPARIGGALAAWPRRLAGRPARPAAAGAMAGGSDAAAAHST
ncbi:glycosyltransferase [Rhizobium sp. TRM95111]|nr:glycosyltransferase family 2 protein [Rhizobium alarense]MCF3641978.1 glycosyltransferase [Rhizobium alarense]